MANGKVCITEKCEVLHGPVSSPGRPAPDCAALPLIQTNRDISYVGYHFFYEIGIKDKGE